MLRTVSALSATAAPPSPKNEPVELAVTLPPKTGLNADSFRVLLVFPSMAKKSSVDDAEAVLAMSLIRIGILDSRYEFVIEIIDKEVTSVRHQIVYPRRGRRVVPPRL
jgi:hypothetical protein